MPDFKLEILAALAHRGNGGGHKHHSACIHNLPPEEQVTVRGKTVEWWTKVVGPLPEQITPADWEIEEPEFVRELGRKLAGGGTDAE